MFSEQYKGKQEYSKQGKLQNKHTEPRKASIETSSADLKVYSKQGKHQNKHKKPKNASTEASFAALQASSCAVADEMAGAQFLYNSDQSDNELSSTDEERVVGDRDLKRKSTSIRDHSKIKLQVVDLISDDDFFDSDDSRVR